MVIRTYQLLHFILDRLDVLTISAGFMSTVFSRISTGLNTIGATDSNNL